VISYNLVPSIFVIFFYFFFIRGMIIGGGDIYSKWSIVNQVAQLTLGFPEGNLFRYLALLTVLVIFLFGIYTMYRQHNEEWLFYVVVLSAAPVVLVLLTKPVYFQVRYLVLCIPFFYLLFCYVLGKCYRAVSFNGRWFVTVLLIVFVLGQSFRLIPLLRFGRGAFMEALLYISQNTKGSALIVGSDNDFRTGMVLHFYSRFLPKNKTLRYVEQDSVSRFAPTWFLTQSQNVLYRPPPKIVLKKVGPYRLIKSYPYSGISGSAWYLYRHEINE